MTKEERQQSLVNARRACLMLVEFATGAAPAIILSHGQREEIACLIEEFGRLDANARRPRAGRPRLDTDNPKTLAQRRWRDKKK